MMVDASVLQVRGLRVEVPGKTLLAEVDLSVNAGEVVGLVGPNGAGKTTLLRVLAGVRRASAGEVWVQGSPQSDYQPRQLARRVAYLAQNAEVSWPLSAANVVALGRLPYRQSLGGARPEDHDAVQRALERTDTWSLRSRNVSTLSGGERMRVNVARALAVEADVLLADEPVAGLDPYFQLEVMDLLADEAAAGRAVIVVLHDLALALRYCDRVVLLDEGRVAAVGEPREVLSADAINRVYRVEVVQGEHDGKAFVLPWQRVDS